jgi:transposase, IS5 family
VPRIGSDQQHHTYHLRKSSARLESEYVYHRLRRFRAGIESGISWLKRSMGLDRCTWKAWEAFKSYVWSSIVAANL